MIADYFVLKLVLHKAVRLSFNFMIIFRALSETLEYKFRFDISFFVSPEDFLPC